MTVRSDSVGRSNTAGTLALAIATAGVFGAVAVSAWSEPSNASAVHAVVRADLDVDAPQAIATGARLEAVESAETSVRDARSAALDALRTTEGFHATLRVVDDRTGLTIPTAWFQRSEFGALDRRAQRHDASPGRKPVRLHVTESRATVLVAAPRYATQDVLIDRPGEIEVRLTRATSIQGAVLDGRSAGVSSARVTLEFLGSTLDGVTEESEAIPIKGPTLRRTDADGRYVFSNVAPGVYRTVVEVEGAKHASRPRLVLAGEWLDVDHWLDESTRLAVQVDRPDGLPAARARLLVQRDGDAEPTLTRYTGEDGRATLGPLDPGSYRVSVQSVDGTAIPQSLSIQDDGRAVVDLHLQLARAAARGD